jgi:hypothetical protein
MKTKKDELLQAFGERYGELKAGYQRLVNDISPSTGMTLQKSTASVQRAKYKKDKAIMALVIHLAKGCSQEHLTAILSDKEATLALNNILYPEEGPNAGVAVEEGDSLVALLQKYGYVKDVYNKLLKNASVRGLRLDGDKFIRD